MPYRARTRRRWVRGFAASVAIAITIIVVATTIGLLKLWQTYVSSQQAMMEYGKLVQKPIFVVEDIQITPSEIYITLVNRGPGPANVKRVAIYTYDNTGIPANTIERIYGTTVPVGGEITVTLTVDEFRQVYGYGKPLRILVETDKGLSIISYPPVTGDLFVNIRVPKYMVKPATLNKILVSIRNPTGYYSVTYGLGSAQPCAGPPDENQPICIYDYGFTYVTFSIYQKVIAGATYEIELRSTSDVPITMLYAEPFAGISDKGIVKTKIDYRIIDYKASVKVNPGDSVSVDISIPEVIRSESNIEITEQTEELQANVIDFSWYYTSWIKGEPYIESTWTGTEGPFKGPSDDTIKYGIEQVTRTLVSEGVVNVVSPAGCSWEPGLNTNDENLLYKYFIQWQPDTSLFGALSLTSVTGIVFSVLNYPDACSNLASTNIVLQVDIPLGRLNGKYVIVPVLMLTDTNTYTDNNEQMVLNVYVVDSQGNPVTPTGLTDIPTQSDAPAIQYAKPIVGNFPNDNYFLRIRVIDTDMTKLEKTDVHLVISKIVIIKTGLYSTACAFQVDNIPAIPFVVLDLNSGTITRNGYLMAAFSSATTIPNPTYPDTDADRDAITVFDSRLILAPTITDRTLRLDPSGITLTGSTNYNPVRPVYAASGFSIEVHADETPKGSFAYCVTPAAPAAGPEPEYTYSSIFSLYFNTFKTEGHEFAKWGGSMICEERRDYDGDEGLYLNVDVTFGQTGTYYVIIGYLSATTPERPWDIPPTTGYQVLSGTGRADRMIPNNPEGYVGSKTDNLYTTWIIYRAYVNSAGTKMRFYITPGTLSTYVATPDEANYVLRAITYVFVVKDPNTLGYGTLPSVKSTDVPDVGLVVRNLQLAPGVSGAIVRVVDPESGNELAKWWIPQDTISPNGVILNIDAYSSLIYSGGYWPEPWLYEYHKLMVIVQNAICPTGTYTGGGGGGGGGGASRAIITITERSGNNLNNYPVKIVLTSSNFPDWGLLTADSIYFTDTSGNPLYYWIQKFDSTNKVAVIWVKVPSIPAYGSTDIYMYYGGTNPYSNYNNPSQVFIFFDNFESWTGWTQYGSGVVSQYTTDAWEGSASAKKDTYADPNGAYKAIGTTISPSSTSLGIAIEGYMKRLYLSGANADRVGLIDDNGNGWGFVFIHGTTPRIGVDDRISYSGYVRTTTTLSSDIFQQWYRFRLTVTTNRITAYLLPTDPANDNAIASVSYTSSLRKTWTRVYIFGGWRYLVDLLIVRPIALPEPSVTITTG